MWWGLRSKLREDLQQNWSFRKGAKFRFSSSTCLSILKHSIPKVFPSRTFDWRDFLSYSRHVPLFPATPSIHVYQNQSPRRRTHYFPPKSCIDQRLHGIDTWKKTIVRSTVALWRPGNHNTAVLPTECTHVVLSMSLRTNSHCFAHRERVSLCKGKALCLWVRKWLFKLLQEFNFLVFLQ